MAAAAQIRSIYAMGSSLGINQNSQEDELHQLVYGITGKASIKQLTSQEVCAVQRELMDRMKLSRNTKCRSAKRSIDVPPGKMTEAQQRKAWSLIYKLQELSPSGASAPDRMRGAVRKILGVEINMDSKTPFRMIPAAGGRKLIDVLKKYVDSAEKKAAHNED